MQPGRNAHFYARLGAIGVLTVVAAGFAARNAVANVYARAAPELALRANPGDGRALLAQLNARLATDTSGKPLTPADLASVRSALRANPMSAGLIRILGLGAYSDDNAPKARSLMALSSRVSRRDLIGQLWMIEDAVLRNDIKEAVRHYDIALTISREVQAALFPVLTDALAEREVREAVAPYLVAQRPWRQAFLTHAAEQGKPAEVAATLVTAGLVNDPALQDIQTNLLLRFVAAGDVAGAEQHALRIRGATAARFDRLDFTSETSDPVFRPFSWALTKDSEIEASLDGSNQLQIRVSPNAQGYAATRVMRLAPGTYGFTMRNAFLGTPPAFARWDWYCIGANENKIWEQEITVRPGTATQRFNAGVPAGCTGVRMVLSLTGIEGQDSNMTIEQIAHVSANAANGNDRPAGDIPDL